MSKATNISSPLVSVIIPTYNKSHFLKHTIESVINQTYSNIEIIVIDDGSTDNTEELAKSYGSKIKYIKQNNLGGTASRNTGIKSATGKYLNFLDHDDLFLPEKIEKQVRVLESNPKVGFVHCRYFFIDEIGKQLAKVFILPEGNIYKKLIAGCFIWSGAPLIRKSCIDKVGIFDESIWSSDWDMWLRIVKEETRIACVQEPLGEYRIHHESTMLNVEKTENDDVKILDKVFADPNQNPEIRNFKNEAYARWRLWLSCRYFATNSIEDGKRNLENAIETFPGLINNKENFIRRISDEAVDFRVVDPLKFINNVFLNLPANAGLISKNSPRILSNIYLRMALRSYAESNFEKGKLELKKSTELKSSIKNILPEFYWCMFVYSMRHPSDTSKFVEVVYNNLTDKLKELKKYKHKVISHINIAKAYERYSMGDYNHIVNNLIKGLVNFPSLKFLLKTWKYYS